MNVIISNELQGQLSDLDIDVIKSISGVYDVNEIVEMFKNFFYSKMILDVTSLKNYNDFKTYEVLARGLDPDKIIFLLPEGSQLCTPSFLTRLITVGIYNFTTNVTGINYLVKKSNTLKDVEHITKMVNNNMPSPENDPLPQVQNISQPQKGVTILGFKDVTEGAGATTFAYLVKKELSLSFGQESVLAIEIDKNDFALFNDQRMISARQDEIKSVIDKAVSSNVNFILIDLNGCNDDSFCTDIVYLIEPSTIKLNKLVRKSSSAFSKLVGKKVVLTKSVLVNNDVFDFESEAGIKVFYNLPPVDERKRNAYIADFLGKLGILNRTTNDSGNKIFGLFRR